MKNRSKYVMLVSFSIFAAILLIFTAVAVPVTQSIPINQQKEKTRLLDNVKHQFEKLVTSPLYKKYCQKISSVVLNNEKHNDITSRIEVIKNNDFYKNIEAFVQSHTNEIEHQRLQQQVYNQLSKSNVLPLDDPFDQLWDDTIVFFTQLIVIVIEMVSILFGHNPVSVFIGYIIGVILFIIPLMIVATGIDLLVLVDTLFELGGITDLNEIFYLYGIIGGIIFVVAGIALCSGLSILVYPFVFLFLAADITWSVMDVYGMG